MTVSEVRALTSDDRTALEHFSCRTWSRPWTDDIDATIHELADELDRSAAIEGHGVWVGDRPMLALNMDLGANVVRIEGVDDHAHCIIAL